MKRKRMMDYQWQDEFNFNKNVNVGYDYFGDPYERPHSNKRKQEYGIETFDMGFNYEQMKEMGPKLKEIGNRLKNTINQSKTLFQSQQSRDLNQEMINEIRDQGQRQTPKKKGFKLFSKN